MVRQPSRRRREANPPARKAVSRPRRVAFTVLAVLLPVFLFATIEIVLRLMGVGYPTSFFIPVAGTDGLTTNPRFAWRFFPPALARTPLVGWMPSEKNSATFRVFVLGESAAMGVPEPAFGVSRMLEVMLAEAYPAVKVEIVNTAMTAINSHVIREIARECARHQPDAFIIYMGNNEVVGPYGPATIFTRAAPALPLVRARLLLDRTRTGQLAGRLLQRLTRQSPGFSEWRGMEMLTRQQIPAGDPRLATTYDHFRENLNAVLEAARAAGAPAVVSTIAVNLRDSPPFGSQYAQTPMGAERARWDAAVQRGAELQAGGRHADAVNAYREALAIDDEYAEVHFRIGTALLASGRVAEALDALIRARDLDVLRFRADSGINAVIRSVAHDRANRDVVLVDAEHLFAEESAGAPGNDLFWEHVHLNAGGNYLLARAFFAQVGPLLERRFGVSRASSEPASAEQVTRQLTLTRWNQLRMASDIFEMMKRPPFTRQLGHAERIAQRRDELAALRAASRDQLEATERTYRAAIANRPDDLQLRPRFATLLRERGKFAEAADEWRALLARVPGVIEWRSQLAFALSDQAAQAMSPAEGSTAGFQPTIPSHASRVPDHAWLLAEAESVLRAIVDEESTLPAAHANLGTVLERQGRLDAAIEEYSEALRLDSGYQTARSNLAALAASRGELDEASRLYGEAIALDSVDAESHARLGGVLERQQRPREAIAEYRRALELDPDLARVRNTLAYALERQGETADAIEEYRRAIESDPDYILPRINLADLLMREQRLADAARELREVHAREPDQPAALIGLALILATADEPALRNPTEAVRLAERAAAVSEGAPEAFRTLAVAYASAGRLRQAIEAAGRGADIARARGDARLAAMLDEQARRYREAADRVPGQTPPVRRE